MVTDPVFEPVAFSDIPAWQNDDHSAAMAAFRVSAERMAKRPYTTKRFGAESALLAAAAARALSLSNDELPGGDACRAFFETWFAAHRLRLDNASGHDFDGFVTGYFEPEIEVSGEYSTQFPVPILKRPPDLVEIDDTTRPSGLPDDFFFARQTPAGLGEYYDRAAIENGALNGAGLEMYWCKSRIELFFVQIQGSAKLRLQDGSREESIVRISYDGKTGHPFTAIGRLLVERGELDAESISMQKIRAWLETHPDQATALMQKNRSYIFFKTIDHPKPDLGPVAAAGVPLTPMRSLAVDHRLHTFGTPVFVETRKPLPGDTEPFSSLMIAQDTGSAIVGPARGDLFIGSGARAGKTAGSIKHPGRFTILLPKAASG